MALTQTTLAAAAAAGDRTFSVTSATGFADGSIIRVDNEFSVQVGAANGTVISVRSRGDQGTMAVAHGILAPITVGLPSDFPTNGSGRSEPITPDTPSMETIGANGALTVPTSVKAHTVLLNKATALSSTTLAAPTKAQNGLVLTITSLTAAAHVITATSLFGDAVSGSPHSTATYAAYIGATMTVMAADGLWNIVSTTGVTIS